MNFDAAGLLRLALLEDKVRYMTQEFKHSRPLLDLHPHFHDFKTEISFTEPSLEGVEIPFDYRDSKTYPDGFDPKSPDPKYYTSDILEAMQQLGVKGKVTVRVIEHLKQKGVSISIGDPSTWVDSQKVPPKVLTVGMPNSKKREASEHPIYLDLVDFNFLSAITNSGLLLSGTSGAGKTHLAMMFANAVFGTENYCSRTITPGMNEESFFDRDFGKMKEGGTLREAMMATPIVTNPAVILNEVNRTPTILQSILIPYLEFHLNLKGLDFPVGVESPYGGRYQFRVISINEGRDYKGISDMDRAVRDRMVIEVPIGRFKPLKSDFREMISQKKSTALIVPENKESYLEDLLMLHSKVTEIPLTGFAKEFLVYLSGLGNCVKSHTGTKEGIKFSTKMCEGCHHAAAEKNICGNVDALTSRSLINLEVVGRGVAALRAYKQFIARIQSETTETSRSKALIEFTKSSYLNDLAVTTEDIIKIAPFVLYSKLPLGSPWIDEHHQGDRFQAVQAVINSAYTRFTDFVREYYNHGKGTRAQLPLTEAMRGIGGSNVLLRKYAQEKDAWLVNLTDSGARTDLYQVPTGDLIRGFSLQLRKIFPEAIETDET